MAQGFKTGGRQKGTPNKVTTQTKETLSSLVERLSEDILDQVDSLSLEDKVSLLPRLLPFIIPRPQAISEGDQNQKPKSLVLIPAGTEYSQVNIRPIEWLNDTPLTPD